MLVKAPLGFIYRLCNNINLCDKIVRSLQKSMDLLHVVGKVVRYDEIDIHVNYASKNLKKIIMLEFLQPKSN